MQTVRKTELSIIYEGEEAARIGTIESFSYSDEACNNSDSISITLDNIDKRWSNGWIPKTNDKIKPSIMVHKDSAVSALKCGEFVVDDFSIAAPPLSCTINATSTSINDGFKAQIKSKTWQSVTVKQIASEIAGSAGIDLVFDADDTSKIEKIEQSNETDAAFLSKLCSDYALKMKTYSSKIIIYSEEKYEDNKALYDITPDMCSSWEYTSSAIGTYTGAVFSYTNAKKNETYTVKVGTDERLLYINESAENAADAEKKALGKLNDANRGLITMSVQLKEPMFLTATTTINIKNFGKSIDGKYFVDRVLHNIDRSGYVVEIGIRKIIERIGKPAENKQEEGKPAQHTTKQTDTLWDIAKKHYGRGELKNKIYDANAETIEAVARSQGKLSSEHGKHLYAGTVLIIPDIDDGYDEDEDEEED